MALINTNAGASRDGHLNPITKEMLVPLVGGAGTSDVIEIGRYNEMSILIPNNDYPASAGFLNFEACDTPDGTFVPLKFGGTSAASAQISLNVRAAEAPALYLLGASGIGGGGGASNDMRGFTVPYLRFAIEGASGLLTATTVIVNLKMY